MSDTDIQPAAAAGPGKAMDRSCPLCDDPNAGTPRHPLSPEDWPLLTCRSCGFVYLSRVPRYEMLFTDLAWERTSKAEDVRRMAAQPRLQRMSKATRWRLHLRRRRSLAALLERHAAPGRVIDLGCGDGGQLHGLSDRFVPYGVEISSELARLAHARFAAQGGAVVNAPSREGLEGFAPGYFTGATLRSYLEHELDPAGVLRALRHALAPGGVALVKVPNYGSLNRRVMRRSWCGFRFPDHVNYFTPASLRRMAEQAGFSVRFASVWRLPTSDNMWAVLRQPP